jgi:tetratricopeptide (TPR) repeat protein
LPALGDWNWQLLSIGGQLQWIEYFGLSNAFLNVAGFGLYVTIAGILVLLIGMYVREGQGRLVLLADTRFIVMIFLIVFGIQLAPRLVAEYHSRAAKIALAQGDEVTAMRELRAANRIIPLMAESFLMQARVGAITFRQDCKDCAETYVYLAQQAITNADYHEAWSNLNRAANMAPALPGLRFWLAATSIEVGLDLFNSGEFSAADEMFARALALTPGDAMGWYGRAVVALRLRNFDAAARYFEQAVRLQSYLNYRRYPLRSQWCRRSRKRTHFCSWKLTLQVRMSLWSGGLIGR